MVNYKVTGRKEETVHENKRKQEVVTSIRKGKCKRKKEEEEEGCMERE